MAKTKRKIVIRAGRLLLAVAYTQARASDPDHVRAQKSKASSEARKRMNQKYSYQKLELSIAANFKPGDLWVTLTYDDAHLPETRKAAIAEMRKYIVLLRRAWRRSGKELRYIYCTEDKHGEGRLHHHIIVNGGLSEAETIRSLWTGGADCDLQRIDAWGGYEALAKYMTKEAREPGGTPVGARTWTPSQNLVKPTRESCMIDDCETVTAPVGAVVLDKDSKVNGWGAFDYIKCLLPEEPEPRRVRPPKRPKSS